MHAGLLLPLYVLIVLAPLALAALQDKPRRPFLDEVSSGLALAAFAVLLAEFVLSGRFRTVSGRIGMDVTMRLHQLLARTALALVLLHPFLYTTPLNPPLPWDPTRQMTLFLGDGALVSGVAAYLLLPALVLTAIFRDGLGMTYERWRLLHGLGALALAGAGAHHVLVAGRYSSDPVLAGFWVLLLALAAASLAWVYAVKPLLQTRRPYRVGQVRKVALRTWELHIAPDGHAGLPFRAGQFVWLNVGHSPFSLAENPFSIASAPAEGPEIRFLIKEAGDFTGRIGAVAPGTRAWIDGPYGHLTREGRSGEGIALIAGGVGIAPLLSILRQMRREGDPRPAVLLHGNRVGEQIVHEEELRALEAEGALRVVHVLSDPPDGWQGETGLPDADLIARVFGFEGANRWLFFLCGPPVMMEVCEKALLAMGVPPRQIVMELFSYD
ncbi:ferredoxin reductase family protein [Futiania mangrovi]|uniref:Ferredoxin reductase family protein n=1 Tax=Futiania mangrovi TaxID=2959716 RepID=A0A9J6PF32_9PROT|nr:ferredoxin reductase family protein [Futiania mangrovii]MCP1337062.1 ferredoxin reductase family protein [Futiania mangrovii]